MGMCANLPASFLVDYVRVYQVMEYHGSGGEGAGTGAGAGNGSGAVGCGGLIKRMRS